MATSIIRPLSKKDLQDALKAQSKELKTYVDTRLGEQTDELAQIVNGAFQDQHDFMEDQFGTVNDRIDAVESRLGTVETKLDRALYIEATHLEARISRLEKHTGLKSPKQK